MIFRASKVYEDDHVLAFNDINPKARVHVLVVPKTCFDRLHEAGDKHVVMLGRILVGVGKVRIGYGTLRVRGTGCSSTKAEARGRRCFICTRM